jgi:hypothetical protein
MSLDTIDYLECSCVYDWLFHLGWWSSDVLLYFLSGAVLVDWFDHDRCRGHFNLTITPMTTGRFMLYA